MDNYTNFAGRKYHKCLKMNLFIDDCENETLKTILRIHEGEAQ